MKQILTFLLAISFIPCGALAEAGDVPIPAPPVVEKKGTIDLDLCETSPFVFKGKLYRLEWHRKAKRLRIMDHDAQAEVSHFGEKHRFPSVIVEGDTVYVIGTKEDRGWFGNTLTVFTSKDLINWQEHVGFTDKDYGICNTSVCKVGDRYVMSIEVNAHSKETNGTFACRFLESKDLLHWTLTPKECRFGFGGGLCSPHLLRYDDGWYYLFSTIPARGGYVLILARSRDLKRWEQCPFNPVMTFSEEDKKIYNTKLTEEERAKVAEARNIDNSDIDFCDYKGKLIINYCWGNQVGKEFIAEAEYAGSTAEYLRSWYPDMKIWKGIDISRPLSTFAKDRSTYGSVLSADAKVTTSSGRNNGTLVSGSCAEPFAFHTEAEKAPWVAIDLGKQSEISGILIRNRTDGFHERAEGLRLLVSEDGREWREVWKAEKIAAEWEIPMVGKDLRARHLRLEARPAKPASFHLHHVEIWGK